MDRVYTIIPAAGQGRRMDSTLNKQFIEIGGIPVIARTLLAFQNSPLVDGIVVVAGVDETGTLLDLCAKYNITKLVGITGGGSTRQDSVRYGLKFLVSVIEGEEKISADECYVLIHDGARPFIKNDCIERCIEGAKKHKACGAGIKVKDTIKSIDSETNRILGTIPRENLVSIQTPQAFSLPLIERLHRIANEESLSFTDDLSLVEHYGGVAVVVDGDDSNIKITTREDLLLAEALLSLI